MILAAFWHGLRSSEVPGITANSIDGIHLTVHWLKGSLKTVQPLMSNQDSMFSELIEYAHGMHGNQKLSAPSRTQFWRIVQKHALAAGVSEHLAHPHIPKHTIAMQTIHSAGIENCRQWLGHVSIGQPACIFAPQTQRQRPRYRKRSARALFDCLIYGAFFKRAQKCKIDSVYAG